MTPDTQQWTGGPDNGFRTLMVISSTLACFHSFCTPLLPTTTEEGLNGLIPQRFRGGERVRDRCIAINTTLALLGKGKLGSPGTRMAMLFPLICLPVLYLACVCVCVNKMPCLMVGLFVSLFVIAQNIAKSAKDLLLRRKWFLVGSFKCSFTIILL